MKNYLQPGDSITVPAPTGGVSSGDGVIVGSLFGVASTDATEGASVVLATHGCYTLPKQLSATFASGAAVSFVLATRTCAVPGSTRYPIGVAVAPATNAQTTVAVRLDGVATAAT